MDRLSQRSRAVQCDDPDAESDDGQEQAPSAEADIDFDRHIDELYEESRFLDAHVQGIKLI